MPDNDRSRVGTEVPRSRSTGLVLAALRYRLLVLSTFAVAMAYLESAVVVYLRAIYYPTGFRFPLVVIPDRMALIEIGREAATILMLAAVAALTGADRWQRFLFFAYAFGIWDLFYYGWLWIFIRWPSSLLEWDILFLIPVPWVAPVLAPVLISLALVAGAAGLLYLERRGVRRKFSRAQWTVASLGGVVVLLSFMLDYESAMRHEPDPFRWPMFALGFALAAVAFARGAWDMAQDGSKPASATSSFSH